MILKVVLNIFSCYLYQTVKISSGIFPGTTIGALYFGKKNLKLPLRALLITPSYATDSMH